MTASIGSTAGLTAGQEGGARSRRGADLIVKSNLLLVFLALCVVASLLAP
ncbi:hypothetical protein [Nonomuraea angiospora]